MLAGIEAFFSAMLYAFPNLNTTFVFPSLILGCAFVALSLNYSFKVKDRIIKDNKS